MLPSLLARDIQNGLKQFLVTGFEPSDTYFHGLMRRFVAQENDWMKGPFLQVGLPFQPGQAGRTFWGHFETEHEGHHHQELAWQRLGSKHSAANTLVATGTGSGKTECFAYPVLDHCARMAADGQKGIKALIIYPMNALATDQAGRFAELVANTPALAGLRVGLFVGGQAGDPGTGMVMTSKSVITDRDTMRKSPPDILLTNYKMLDYLLLRPKDKALWAHNSPTTLQYLVVDELHTFDGAQGTDLALLLRRLRARLKVPDGHLICAGTSATLGNSQDTTALRDYARQIFGANFLPDSVVTEARRSVVDFLEDATIEHLLQPRSDFAEVLNPARYRTQEEAVAAWFGVFFPEQPAPKDVGDTDWRINLGKLLKEHVLFVNLLKRLKGTVVDFAELQQNLQGPLPASAHPVIREVIDALLVLVAWARSTPTLPLVTVRVQVWVRELRRMVARVAADAQSVDLRSSADLKSKTAHLYLPLVQCSECHTTGWLTRQPEGTNKVSSKLDEIYNTWFASRPDAVRLYPGQAFKQPQVEGMPQHLCSLCGNLQNGTDQCQACGHHELVSVFRTIGTRSSMKGQTAYTWHDNTCPACGGRDRQILLGARNATLGSQVVEQTWASPFNDDKKLIAFSDSVQDAAHRAGFFGARTYANTVRTALAKAVDTLAQPALSWGEFLTGLEQLTRTPGSVLHMTPERLVAEFIGPNMTWQHDWVEELVGKGALPANSRLPERVRKRLCWQAVSEFTYLSHRGRNLDRIGKATLAPATNQIMAVAQTLLPRLHEHYGLRGLEVETVAQWVWGFVAHLRRRGGVMHPELQTYVRDGRIYAMLESQGRKEWMPAMGERAPKPVFLTLGDHKDFDRLAIRGQSTWFDRWATASLGGQALLAPGMARDLYVEAITALEAAGALSRVNTPLGDVVALDPAAMFLHAEVDQLSSGQGKRRLTVPKDAAELLKGMPCLDATQEIYEDIEPAGGWLADRFSHGDLCRVVAAEHTGLLERGEREGLERRFKSKDPKPWFENLLSATPTLEMGVDIGALSSVLLCSVPPNQASFLQRVGRAGRRDGNAFMTTLADGSSPHDLYFFQEINEMLTGEVVPPGIFLKAAEVLRRQLFAYCLDDWVGGLSTHTALPEKTSVALDAIEKVDLRRFPHTFCEHVLVNQPRLLSEFLTLLGSDIDSAVTARLTEFIEGNTDKDGLRLRLMKMLEELVDERKQYRKRSELIKAQIQVLGQRPRDEAVMAEIDELQRERDKSLELIKEINQRDLLQTLTDGGLIPNYAFPEAGIELKSVLWRRKSSDDKTAHAYVALPAIRYERPANSALSEFAPENRFYANQRKVEVDQINMGLAKMESWRLCPSCHHMANLSLHPDADGACPRCGDPMWSDQAQKRQLLRFKQAIANSDDTKVRIDDSADDREPKFYVRQLLADFDAQDVTEAWQIKAADMPFGFEFISRVTFRDVNFGELSKPGDSFKVAAQETTRPGFKLCRHCGKVQTPPKRRDEAAGQQHAFDCPQRDSSNPEDIIDCLYLYREFTSEAMRILVPYTRAGIDEEVIQSFMAALQLGLKKRFGGKVDHLRLVTQDEPGRDGGPRRQFVLLYDSVPGGTGYLHQLLVSDAGTLADVLRMALSTIEGCGCNADPEKDGCYRCVYQYRLGRKMGLVSRNRGREVLSELVASLDQLEKVKTISDIFINPNFDSPLEARFVESLRRMGGQHGLPPVKLVQEIVSGKSGFLLEVGAQRYWIEPQKNLGPSEGVKHPSCPDFLIWPATSNSARKPVAVFCDGWAYHKDSLRADARKRSALVASGAYWVWSVTHEDVKAALAQEPLNELPSPLVSLNRHEGQGLPATFPRAEEQAFMRNAVLQLLLWLAKPSEGQDEVVQQLSRNAAWASFLMVALPNQAGQVEEVKSVMSTLTPQLPQWMQDNLPAGAALAASRQSAEPKVRMWWPQSLAKGAGAEVFAPGVLILDDTGAEAEAAQHLQWRNWLALFNTLQTMGGLLLVTQQGLIERDYEALAPNQALLPSQNAQGQAQAAAWVDLAARAVSAIRTVVMTLAKFDLPLPEVGHELPDDLGDVLAEAELAWLDKKVVVLLEHQVEYAETWQAQGWRCVVAQGDWTEQVSALLKN